MLNDFRNAINCLLLVCFFWMLCASASAQTTIFDDGLNGDFLNYSWGSTIDFENQSPALGSLSISVDTSEAYAALYLFTEQAINVSNSDEIQLQLRASVMEQRINVFAVDGSGGFNFAGEFTISDTGWTEVLLHIDELGGLDRIAGVAVQEASGNENGSPPYFVDEVRVGDFAAEPAKQPVPGPAIVIDFSDERGSISDGIYGLNFADQDFADEIGLSVNRWGGNSTTRYNYQIDTTNLASDFYYENMHQAIGQTSDEFVAKNVATGTDSMITIGMLGYVAKSQQLVGSYSVSKYGAQTDVNMYRPDHGNGILLDGSRVQNDPLDTGLPVDEDFAKGWVQDLVSNFGTAANGGVRYYMLDNEPMLWNSTHVDAHPQPAGYDDVFDLGVRYAQAIKEADPSAEVMGPAVFGWTAYFYSALDAAGEGQWWLNPQDQNAHGGKPFLQWYLEEMAQYEAENGTRLLDYLDIHYYPQGENVALEPSGDLQRQQRRLNSTRSLWDPSHTDDSWINDNVQLIPRMKEWIADHYPGTRLAINEYNFGGLEHINGAITQADVLGIFGREGLDIACIWAPPASDQPGAFAFRMYRNYDGNATAGSRFGETAIAATSADSNTTSVFASKRALDDVYTVVLVNKSGDPRITPVTLSVTNNAIAEVYVYDDRNLDRIVRYGDLPFLDGEAEITLPPNSITMLEVAEVTAAPQQPSVAELSLDDGSAQRSRIRSLQLSFDSLVSFVDDDPVQALSLVHAEEGSVALTLDQIDDSSGVTVVSLTFAGPLTRAGDALIDGDYILSLNGLNYFDQGSGVAGENFQAGSISGSSLFSLFGDGNGDGNVDILDFLGFRQSWLVSDPDPRFKDEFDFNDNGTIEVIDLLEFRKRFGTSSESRAQAKPSSSKVHSSRSLR